MKRLDRASGYIITEDTKGKELILETRQCKHCQFTWIYKPGSGNRRGWCMRCYGLVCMREECAKHYTCGTLTDMMNGLIKGLPT